MGWKMVRDTHREVLEGQISGQWRTSPDPVSSLVKKLGEEYSELAENRDPAELYDIQDVLSELIYLLDPEDRAGEAHERKVMRLGRFDRHVEWHPNPNLEWVLLEGDRKGYDDDGEGGVNVPAGDSPDSPAPGKAGLPGGSDDYVSASPAGDGAGDNWPAGVNPADYRLTESYTVTIGPPAECKLKRVEPPI
jgi:predicted house-cleaning noncanonical NTP pyrophosphatase (MazG superfamily)